MVVTVNAGPARWSSKDKNVAVAPEEPFNWTGFYIGGHVGGAWNDYDFGSFDTDVNISEQFFGVRDFFEDGSDIFVRFHTPGEDPSDDSVIGGGQAGYNFQFGHIVVGVEADFSGLDTGRTSQFNDNSAFFLFPDGGLIRPLPGGGQQQVDGFSTDLTTNRAVETSWQASGRLRLGYAQGPVLLYVTGGVAVASVNVRENDRAITTFFVEGGPPWLRSQSFRQDLSLISGSGVSTMTMTTVFCWGGPVAVASSGPRTTTGVSASSIATTTSATKPFTSADIAARFSRLVERTSVWTAIKSPYG